MGDERMLTSLENNLFVRILEWSYHLLELGHWCLFFGKHLVNKINKGSTMTPSLPVVDAIESVLKALFTNVICIKVCTSLGVHYVQQN